ncbi:thioredoxin domain-containing protein [Microbacterium sp. Marseille-Q6965]|uniref:DsbA family protein n=1 Tax=Microbacterium sp. Marseille-Q6965 TaxID=2965072 RepID=UPI0021B76303|nr:thioredoxin domain-containing protein [Microbacterium sp. Marseille-Q6965]
MSSDETPNAPVPDEAPKGHPVDPAQARHGREAAESAADVSRREALREKAKQVSARQSRRRVLTRVGIGVGALAIVGAAAFAITNTVVPEVTSETRVPAGFVDGGFTVNGRDVTAMIDSADATPTPTPTPTQEPEAEETPAAEPVQIRVYVDYLSAESGEFERANAARLARWVEGGDVTLSYHPVALLTPKSNGTKYSQRAVAAAACVATHAPEAFPSFNHALLLDQPEPGTAGYTDEQLADLAVASGATNERNVRECIELAPYLDWARQTTNEALDGALPGTDGVTLAGAPLILVDGEAYVGSLDDPAEFTQFVLTVESDAYLSTPSPTPTPSGSATPAE